MLCCPLSSLLILGTSSCMESSWSGGTLGDLVGSYQRQGQGVRTASEGNLSVVHWKRLHLAGALVLSPVRQVTPLLWLHISWVCER